MCLVINIAMQYASPKFDEFPSKIFSFFKKLDRILEKNKNIKTGVLISSYRLIQNDLETY